MPPRDSYRYPGRSSGCFFRVSSGVASVRWVPTQGSSLGICRESRPLDAELKPTPRLKDAFQGAEARGMQAVCISRLFASISASWQRNIVDLSIAFSSTGMGLGVLSTKTQYAERPRGFQPSVQALSRLSVESTGHVKCTSGITCTQLVGIHSHHVDSENTLNLSLHIS